MYCLDVHVDIHLILVRSYDLSGMALYRAINLFHTLGAIDRTLNNNVKKSLYNILN